MVLATALLALTASSALAARSRVLSTVIGAPGPAAGQMELVSGDFEAARPASGVAVNEATGDLYVADTGNHRIDQFEADGTFVRAWGWGVRDGSAELQTCTSITGCQAGLAGTEAGEFETALAIAVDNAPGGEGDVYVAGYGGGADNRIQKFTSEGALVTTWGAGGVLAEGPLTNNEGLGRTRGLAVDLSGNLWATTGFGLFEFSRAGVYQHITYSELPGEPLALAADAAGDTYQVANTQTQHVVDKYDPEGHKLGQVYEASSEALGLALDTAGPSAGELFVAEGSRIAAIAPGCAPSSSPPFCPAASLISPAGRLTEGASLGFDSTTEVLYATDTAADHVLAFAIEEPGPPTVEAGSYFVSALTATEAELHAELNPRSEPGEGTPPTASPTGRVRASPRVPRPPSPSKPPPGASPPTSNPPGLRRPRRPHPRHRLPLPPLRRKRTRHDRTLRIHLHHRVHRPLRPPRLAPVAAGLPARQARRPDPADLRNRRRAGGRHGQAITYLAFTPATSERRRLRQRAAAPLLALGLGLVDPRHRHPPRRRHRLPGRPRRPSTSSSTPS